MKKRIEKAKVWSDLVWSQAALAWTKRQQDHNYRRYLAQPGICKALSSLDLPKQPKVIDLGCAEGSETFFMAQTLKKLGYKPRVYGFDPHAKMIAKVQNIIFDRGTLFNLLGKYRLLAKVDLLTSVFVLQELPSLDNFLSEVSQALSPKGKAVFMIVHPDFGTALLKKSALVLNKSLSSNADWEFAAAYPIVEENAQTFFLPYFHRSLSGYIARLEKQFQVLSITSLMPSQKILSYCQRQKISPFYRHAGNVYWPEISNQVSSLLITVTKKEVEK